MVMDPIGVIGENPAMSASTILAATDLSEMGQFAVDLAATQASMTGAKGLPRMRTRR